MYLPMHERLFHEHLPFNSQTYFSDLKQSSLVPLYVITWMFHEHFKIKSLPLSLALILMFSFCSSPEVVGWSYLSVPCAQKLRDFCLYYHTS